MNGLSTKARWSLYGLSLAAALLVGRWADGQDEHVRIGEREDRPAPRTEPAAPAATLPTLDLAALGKRVTAPGKGDLFPATSWEQQAQEEARRNAPPPPPPRPPRPQAPPLPFSYMGKMIDESGTVVFLV